MRAMPILLSLCLASGCLEDRGEAEDGTIPEPVLLAFENNCAISGCHDASTSVASLSLARGDVEEIIGKPTPNSALPLVEVGNLYGSYLALKLLADPEIVGEPMPLGGTTASYEIGIILSWIAGLEVPEEIEPPPPPPEVTFADHVLPLMEERCSGPACHDTTGNSASSVFLLDGKATYDAIVNVPYAGRMLVEPGDLDNSHLWQAVTGADGVPMPFNRPPLSGYQLQIIRDWILADAPE